MNASDQLNVILADYKQVEENVFFKRIEEFAARHRDILVASLIALLYKENINIKLKYLLVKAAGELQDQEFLPVIRDTLRSESRVRIVNEILASLTKINTLPAYMIMADYGKSPADESLKQGLEEYFKVLFKKNLLAYHFDVFYRNRGNSPEIIKSSLYLVQNLDRAFIPYLLPAINSNYFEIRLGIFRFLADRPDPAYYSQLYTYFKDNYTGLKGEPFNLLARALVACARNSKLKERIFETLHNFIYKLPEPEARILSVMLMQLNTEKMIQNNKSFYPELKPETKLLFYESLNRAESGHYLDFIKDLYRSEDNEVLLFRITELIIAAKDFEYLFQVLKEERNLRREKLLKIILDLDPPGIVDYLHEYITPDQDNDILLLAVDYLLKNAPDKYPGLINDLMFAGIPLEIKKVIIRNLKRFNTKHKQSFLRKILDDISNIKNLKKEFLLSLLPLLNNREFDPEFAESLINKILVLMEEALDSELVDFVYFFDKYKVTGEDEFNLITDELKLIQNTLLKTADANNLVGLIHRLIKKMKRNLSS